MLSWWRATLFTHVRAYLLAASAAAVFAMPPQVAPAPTAADLARAIQEKYDTVRDFSASFEHRYRGGVLRKEALERGTMQVKKPSRMRWTYESPERKIFVADGTRIYSYFPEDKQVIVAPMPAEAEATTPALFLSGHGSLPRDFEASFAPEADPLPGTYSLEVRSSPPGGRVRLADARRRPRHLPPAQAHHRRRAGRAIDVHLF